MAFAAGLLATSTTRLFSTTYYAQEKVAKVGVALFTASLALALAKIGVAAMGLGVVALGIAYQAEPLAKLLVLGLVWRGTSFGTPRRGIARQYARYAAPLAAQRGLNTLSGNVDKVLLEWLSDTQQVGFYTANLGTSGAMFRLSTAATRVFFPRTVADAERGDLLSAGRRLHAVVRYLLLLGVPAVVLVVAFSQEIVQITLGPEFANSASTLSILILHGLCRMMTAPYSSMLMALDKQAYLLPLRAVSLLVLVVGQLVLVSAGVFGLPGAGLGSAGAAVALLLSALAELAMHIVYTARFGGSRPPGSLLWFIAGGFLMFAVIWYPAASGLVTSLVVKALLAVAAGAGFLALMVAVRQISKDELGMMIQAINPVHLFRYAHGELTESEDGAP
jgi:O-antigen/teichoic acid export membrane protein